MAKLPSGLVFFAIIMLLIQESFGKNQVRIWLLSVRATRSVSVKEGGGVSTAPSNPTLYSLIRVRMIPPEDIGTSPKFTLEGVAAGHRICMNKNGLITTEDMKLKKRKKKRNRNENYGTKIKIDIFNNNTNNNNDIRPKQHVSKNCIFQSYTFNSTMIYKFGTAIYSLSNTNSSVGQFIAFNRHGNLRRYRRPLNNVKNYGIVIQFLEPNNNMNQYINATTFNRCDGKPGGKIFNKEIKQCIRKRKRATMLNHIRHSNILFRAIQKCQRETCKSRRTKMIQDSLQRDDTE